MRSSHWGISMGRAKMVAVASALVVALPSQATLFDRGNGMVYDSAQNLTWLQDWNLARSSGVDADGLMPWGDASVWASSLRVGGFSDWRLPVASSCDASSICTESELRTLLLAEATFDFQTQTVTMAPFINVQSGQYWTGTVYGTANCCYHTVIGSVAFQTFNNQFLTSYVVAVRTGDVAAVPEPANLSMLLLGIAGLVAIRSSAKRRGT